MELFGGPYRLIAMKRLRPEALVVSARGAESFSSQHLAAMTAVCDLDVRAVPGPLSPDQFVDLAHPFQLLAVTRRPCSDIGPAIIERLPNLRVLAVHTTADHWIDRELLARRGVSVLTLPGYATTTVAEHAMACLLTLSRRTHLSNDRSRRLIGDEVSLRGFELRGRRLGLIGHGKIGREVERLATAFGMEVVVTDPASPAHRPLEQVLDTADIVMLAASHERGRRPIIGQAELHRMRARYVVNPSCGELVDHDAMARALRQRQLDGYAVDDFYEALTDPLIEPGRVVQTMHTGWYADEAMDRGVDGWVANIVEAAAALTASSTSALEMAA